MTGAQALIETLVACGVDVCFGNPGTSEMHFVAALDEVPAMRAVLGLHEGVVTGAADGYGRMTGRPAATLLHLGPGLANGLASLHNARRARTPIVNVVGEHATTHKRYDAPLNSDIEALAGWLQGWVRTTNDAARVGADAAEAVAAARAGQIATLILPADVSWSDVGEAAAPLDVAEVNVRSDEVEIDDGCVLLLGGAATREPTLLAASRISAATGARVFVETFPARFERGAGRPPFERLGYLTEHVEAQLDGARRLVLVGSRSPVSFFAYPGRRSDLVPEGCTVHEVAPAALEALAPAGVEPAVADASVPDAQRGPIDAASLADTIAAVLPEGAIVADESITSGRAIPYATYGAPRHDVLAVTGGAIGQALPVATGAAVACPDRPVLCLESDGSAMYSLTALWTQARERLNVTNVILNNSAYAILRIELSRVGARGGGERANSLLDLSRPDLDFLALARGMGVPATRATTCEELAEQLRASFAEPGPHVIDAVVVR